MLDKDICPFSQFRDIRYTKDHTTTFYHDDQVNDCLFDNASAKFPHNALDIKLHWLSADYMDISVSGNQLTFKVSA